MVAHRKFDMQARMPRVQAHQEVRFADAQHDRLRAGQADDAVQLARSRLYKTL